MNARVLTARGRLRRSDCAGVGIRRIGRGRGFSYEDGAGSRIDDEETLARIRALAIPPAWKEVWICPDPLGHIQATGYDEASRKQYRDHERWEQRQATRKYEAMREFARRLPRLRRAVKRDLALEGMPRQRALACAVRLLDLGFFRIGGEEYAENNESYGVATVLREHVRREGKEIVSPAHRFDRGDCGLVADLSRQGDDRAFALPSEGRARGPRPGGLRLACLGYRRLECAGPVPSGFYRPSFGSRSGREDQPLRR